MCSKSSKMLELGLGSNTTANTVIAQPSKGISMNIVKPFPNLPQSKLYFHFLLCIPGSIGDLDFTKQYQNWIRLSSCPSSSKTILVSLMLPFKICLEIVMMLAVIFSWAVLKVFIFYIQKPRLFSPQICNSCVHNMYCFAEFMIICVLQGIPVSGAICACW